MHEAIKTWNEVAKGILSLEESWSKHVAAMSGRPNLELLPVRAQKFLRHTFNRSKFEVAIGEILDYMRVIGGSRELLLSITEDEEEETE